MEVDNKKDMHGAAKALREWLRSQEISPAEAPFLFGRVLTEQMMAAHRNAEVVEIAVLLMTLPDLVKAVVKSEISVLLKEEASEALKSVKDPKVREALRRTLKL